MIRHRPSAFWLFLTLLAALLAAMLALGGPASPADRALLRSAQIEALVPAARMLTHGGDGVTAVVVGSLVALAMLWRGARRQAMLLMFVILSQRAAVEWLKAIFDRARPDPEGRLVAVHSMAYPSGHAAGAMTLGLALALLLPLRPERRPWLIALALAFAFAVGFTRLVLGAHWPSDVAGGWAFGALWTLLLVRLFGTSPAAPH
jgi:undecaprenyl-diphosphatase